LDELKSLSEVVNSLKSQIELLEGKKVNNNEARPTTIAVKNTVEQKVRQNESASLKKSSFRDQFMNSNKLISRPEATALYVGSTNIPNPEELSKKDKIEVVENNAARLDERVVEKYAYSQQIEPEPPKRESIQEPKHLNKMEPQHEDVPEIKEEHEQKPKQETTQEVKEEAKQELKQTHENNTQKDVNLFKKIGDFFK
jgi:hypothetical protein